MTRRCKAVSARSVAADVVLDSAQAIVNEPGGFGLISTGRRSKVTHRSPAGIATGSGLFVAPVRAGLPISRGGIVAGRAQSRGVDR
jgi:3-deoxy-D-manno-octulosonic acid (KDO) 8-phosphate synthase